MSADLLQNEVSFITFNYDLSLETALRSGLPHIQLFKPEHVEEFLADSRIIHIYGKLRDASGKQQALNWAPQFVIPNGLNESDWGSYHSNFRILLDAIYDASVGLRVIDPHDKASESEKIRIANNQIVAAKRVLILGYGFDENNSVRLGLREALAHGNSPAYVSFTNFEDSNRVNKRASNIFFGSGEQFRAGGASLVAGHYEKSTRNAYDALAYDFDM